MEIYYENQQSKKFYNHVKICFFNYYKVKQTCIVILFASECT